LAEAVAENLVDADHYWPNIGLNQRFFLMVLPGGDKQLSLALLSRGERLMYAVVGENDKVVVCERGDGTTPPAVAPSFVDGASIDLGTDARAGRGTILLHRTGLWKGSLAFTDGALQAKGRADYEERLETKGDGLLLRVAGGGLSPEPANLELKTDGWQAWSGSGAMVGSYTLFGGRASAGTFHRVGDELRIWRREVVSHDGATKAVVQNFYRGGVRVGVQHGLLRFSPA
jgi:hypothetical protein